MKHKPFHNDMDKARTLGFIKALRDAITQHGSKPIKRQVPIERLPWVEPTAETKALSLQELHKIKDRLKKGKANELDEQD